MNSKQKNNKGMSLNPTAFAGEKTPAKASFLQNTKLKNGTPTRAKKLIQCYPNPASNIVHFKYTLPENTTQAVIKIYDNVGKLIKSIAIEKTDGIELYNTEKQSNGLYYYTLIVSNTTIASGKFIINK